MITQRRGKNVALAGIAVQFLLAAVVLIVWRWTNCLAAMSAMLWILAGLPLWFMVALLFYCRQLARTEALELEEIKAQGAGRASIFEQSGRQLQPAAARAAFMDRWITPIFTLLWAGLQVALGVLVLRYVLNQPLREIQNTAQGMLLLLVAGFAAFLFSRYTIGMSKEAHWRLLRAAGAGLLGNVLIVAAVLAGLIGAHQKNVWIDWVVALVVPIVQFILATELVLNFLLNIYRPRLPGQEYRPSFDSRLLNFLSEPERVGHSIAEAMNYQFGFEVSRTWFYQLLARAFLPLLVFGTVAMFAMSSIVVVRQGEHYVVQHWGKADSNRALLGPGIHLKWPWPIDAARRFETGKVHEILLGVGDERPPTIVNGRELYLWTEEHGTREELDFLVAVPPQEQTPTKATGETPPPSVNLIKLIISVQYIIEDPYAFGFGYDDADQMLQCLAYREMSRYCASATLSSPIPGGDSDRPEAIMTYGRKHAAEELKRRIQQQVEQRGLGVRIQYIGMAAVHPPAEAAPAYEEVLEAERRMLQTRYEAEAEANEILVQVAGDPLAALKLALAIRSLEEFRALRDEQNTERLSSLLTQQIRLNREDIQALDEEIRQEKLLGQAHPDQEKLRQEYSKHLQRLEAIQADPAAWNAQAEIQRARKTADDLFDQAVGTPAELVARAEAESLDKEITEASRAAAFERERMAYQASPNMYMMNRWLDVWDEALPNVTKYVIGVDRDKLELRLNWERQTELMEGVYQAKPKQQ